MSLLDWMYCEKDVCHNERVGWGKHCAKHKTKDELLMDRLKFSQLLKNMVLLKKQPKRSVCI